MASSSTWTTPSGIAGAACGNGLGLGQQLRSSSSSSSSRSLRISKRELNRTQGGVQGQVNDLTQHYLASPASCPSQKHNTAKEGRAGKLIRFDSQITTTDRSKVYMEHVISFQIQNG